MCEMRNSVAIFIRTYKQICLLILVFDSLPVQSYLISSAQKMFARILNHWDEGKYDHRHICPKKVLCFILTLGFTFIFFLRVQTTYEKYTSISRKVGGQEIFFKIHTLEPSLDHGRNWSEDRLRTSVDLLQNQKTADLSASDFLRFLSPMLTDFVRLPYVTLTSFQFHPNAQNIVHVRACAHFANLVVFFFVFLPVSN